MGRKRALLVSISYVDFKAYAPNSQKECNRDVFFNWSLCPIPNSDNYFYVVRHYRPPSDAEVIPGNGVLYCEQLEEPGQNCIWNNWHSGEFADACSIFVGNHETGHLTYLERLGGDDMRLCQVHQAVLEAKGKTVNEILSPGDIIVHSSGLQNVHKVTTNPKGKKYLLHPLSQSCDMEKSFFPMDEKAQGKNQQFIFTKGGPLILDWVYSHGLQFIYNKSYPQIKRWKTDSFWGKTDRDSFYVGFKSNRKRLQGAGSLLGNRCLGCLARIEGNFKDACSNCHKSYCNYGITPAFSFGSNVVIVEDRGRKFYLGVGHSKITTRNRYMPGSKIEIFRNKVHEQFRREFGQKYKRHNGAPDSQGYIYLLYFYLIDSELLMGAFDDVKTRPPREYSKVGYIRKLMRISDSYLPVDMESWHQTQKYMFSLFFPTGLVVNSDQTISVSCGEGDFYSTLLKFDLKAVIKSCRHDMLNLDMGSYQYHVLGQSAEGRFKCGPTLESVIRK